jgi:sulfatase maturation enzyme AslB (radical SAM superfamily)
VKRENDIEYPQLVAIETTNRCNAKCSFCPNSGLKRDRSIMDDGLFEKIVRDCTHFHLPHIEPFLQGEPFMDPRIFDRLDLIRRLLPDTKLGLYTNGAALTPAKADKLRGLGVDQLCISLNTPDAERYQAITGMPFERTMENLRYLCSPHPKGPVARKITVRMTVLKDTTPEEKGRFRALCRELGVGPSIVGLFNYKGDIPTYLPIPRWPCEHINRLDVLVDGRTTLCCMDQEGEYGWGTVADRSVLETHNSPEAQRVRFLLRTGRRAECEPCNRCTLFWADFHRVSLPRRLVFWAQLAKYHCRFRPAF